MTRQNGWSEFRKNPIAFKMIGIGWYIAFCLGAGLGGGWLLDNYLDIFPVFTLILLTFGLFLAFYGIYRMIVPLLTESKNTSKKEDNG